MATDKRTGGGASGSGGRQRQGSTGGSVGAEDLALGYRSFNDMDARNFLENWAQNKDTMSIWDDGVMGAIDFYQNDEGFEPINEALRGGGFDDGPEGERVAAFEAEIAYAMSQSRSPANIIVNRLWGGDLATSLVDQSLDGTLQMAINRGAAMYSDAAYGSTSLNEKSEFASKPVRSIIRVPKGANALPIVTGSDYDMEREVLLPKGSSFRIRQFDYDSDADGKMVLLLYVDLVV